MFRDLTWQQFMAGIRETDQRKLPPWRRVVDAGLKVAYAVYFNEPLKHSFPIENSRIVISVDPDV